MESATIGKCVSQSITVTIAIVLLDNLRRFKMNQRQYGTLIGNGVGFWQAKAIAKRSSDTNVKTDKPLIRWENEMELDEEPKIKTVD